MITGEVEAGDRKQKIRDRYKGVDISELEVIPAKIIEDLETSSVIRRVAAYIRVSTDDQIELSPESQMVELRKYAKQNNIVILNDHIYMEDKGISGRTAKRRPAFNDMIAHAKSEEHPFDCILVWKFSRFARNQEESIVYKSLLRKSNVDVISISEGIPDGFIGQLVERIFEWYDEYYLINLSGEVRRSMTLNAQEGAYQSRPPFGYDYVGKKIPPTINTEQADYYGAAEPPVRCGVSHLSGLTEPLH